MGGLHVFDAEHQKTGKTRKGQRLSGGFEGESECFLVLVLLSGCFGRSLYFVCLGVLLPHFLRALRVIV